MDENSQAASTPTRALTCLRIREVSTQSVISFIHLLHNPLFRIKELLKNRWTLGLQALDLPTTKLLNILKVISNIFLNLFTISIRIAIDFQHTTWLKNKWNLNNQGILIRLITIWANQSVIITMIIWMNFMNKRGDMTVHRILVNYQTQQFMSLLNTIKTTKWVTQLIKNLSKKLNHHIMSTNPQTKEYNGNPININKEVIWQTHNKPTIARIITTHSFLR